MKRRTKILIIIAAVLALLILWCVGYSALKANDRRIRNKALNNIVSEYITSDADFEAEYGKVVSTEIYKEAQYISTGRKEVEVPCVVNVEDGRSYIVWVKYDFSGEKDVFSYISVAELND